MSETTQAQRLSHEIFVHAFFDNEKRQWHLKIEKFHKLGEDSQLVDEDWLVTDDNAQNMELLYNWVPEALGRILKNMEIEKAGK